METDILVRIAPGVHYPSTRPGPLIGLCGFDGAYGSAEFVTCPRCLQLIFEALRRVDARTAVG
jgi:hypothetical protein